MKSAYTLALAVALSAGCIAQASAAPASGQTTGKKAGKVAKAVKAAKGAEPVIGGQTFGFVASGLGLVGGLASGVAIANKSISP